MKIYLVRHGETAWNKQMIIQGITDNPLNETGTKQAYDLKQFFDNIDLDLVISSSLDRARQTAAIATSCEPDIIDDRFIERDFGSFEGAEVQKFLTRRDAGKPLDIEPDEQVQARVMLGLNEYSQTAVDKVAIFAHSHVLKAALTIIEPDTYTFSSLIKNCAIVELEYADDQFSLVDIH
ncbi:histidine phosphatase family protein [Mollicutes bacterium LVI A0039]|nr:histidine phosphatase family protein [Mollicutes bacterium LVI A0039]